MRTFHSALWDPHKATDRSSTCRSHFPLRHHNGHSQSAGAQTLPGWGHSWAWLNLPHGTHCTPDMGLGWPWPTLGLKNLPNLHFTSRGTHNAGSPQGVPKSSGKPQDSQGPLPQPAPQKAQFISLLPKHLKEIPGYCEDSAGGISPTPCPNTPARTRLTKTIFISSFLLAHPCCPKRLQINTREIPD